MKPLPPNDPQGNLEARITALILGELSSPDAAELEKLIAADPEVAELRNRLQRTADLIRQASEESEHGGVPLAPPARLGDAKREALLASFKTVRPPAFAPGPTAARRRGVVRLKGWLVPVAIAASFVVVGAVLLLPSLKQPSLGLVMDSARIGEAAPAPLEQVNGQSSYSVKLPMVRLTQPEEHPVTLGSVLKSLSPTEPSATRASTDSQRVPSRRFAAAPDNGVTPGQPLAPPASPSAGKPFFSAKRELKDLSEFDGTGGGGGFGGGGAAVTGLPSTVATPPPAATPAATVEKPAMLTSQDARRRVEALVENRGQQVEPSKGETLNLGFGVASSEQPRLAPAAAEESKKSVTRLGKPEQLIEGIQAFQEGEKGGLAGSLIAGDKADSTWSMKPTLRGFYDASAKGIQRDKDSLESLGQSADQKLKFGDFDADGRRESARVNLDADDTLAKQSEAERSETSRARSAVARVEQRVDTKAAGIETNVPQSGAAAGGEDKSTQWHLYALSSPSMESEERFSKSFGRPAKGMAELSEQKEKQMRGDPAPSGSTKATASGEPVVNGPVTSSGSTLSAGALIVPSQMADRKQEETLTRRLSVKAPTPQPEIATAENPFSTFSLNVSDVSFRLASAALENGQLPDPSTVRTEEFINSFDYRDPSPVSGAPLGFAWERARYPFAHNRDLVRIAVKTAGAGREEGRPLNLVLLLDNSGSMERSDRVKIIGEALRVLAGKLQAQDKLTVITFSRTPSLRADGIPGSKALEVLGVLDSLTPEGGTNLEEALRAAYASGLRHFVANGLNRVVLLTDGAANLGDVEPARLRTMVEEHRKKGIALDCFGIGFEGYDDEMLESLSRNGDGRYAFINTPEAAATEFADKLAGALQIAAADVKVQVEFNPARVSAYRQMGYAKHQLTKEQFRDNTVDAAEIAGLESGNSLYVIELKPDGVGPIGTVRVRYKVPGTVTYQELEWVLADTGGAPSLMQSSLSLRLAGAAAGFAEWLVGSPFAAEITPDQLLQLLEGVPERYAPDARPASLVNAIRQAKSIAGR